jgi:putative transposase
VLAAHRGTADAAGGDWKSAVYQKVQEEVKTGGRLTVERMVELGRVSRSGFYRFDDTEPGPDPDMDLRDAIQKVAVEWPSYGRPRITAELRRRGWKVNPKRVYRLMREDNLLCLRRRKFVVTADSHHTRKVYPNLTRDMILTATDQLWRADITYIRLRDEFVFLAVILDAYSRRVIGWALDRTMEDSLTLTALRMALSRRVVQAGLTHHSDRGSQYASNDYTDLLQANGVAISMAQGQPVGQCGLRVLHENAEIRRGTAQRIPRLGRGSRFHPRVPRKSLQPKAAAFGARLPAASRVRSQSIGCRCAAACFMSFPRHREIFPSDGGASLAANASAHRLDEFPAGYSLAGCSPAEPASASPAGRQCAVMSSCRSRAFHRTVNCVSTVCVSRGGKRNSPLAFVQARQ